MDAFSIGVSLNVISSTFVTLPEEKVKYLVFSMFNDIVFNSQVLIVAANAFCI